MVQETRIRSLGWEVPLEKGMAIHSSILAWRIPWTEKPGGLYSLWGRKELDTTEQLIHKHTHPHTHTPLIGLVVFPIFFNLSLNFQDSPGGSDSKASAYNAGDPGSIPRSEDLLEKEMATHSSILAWKTP